MTKIDFSIYENFIAQLRLKLKKGSPLILAIDGMCGSGKTTFAEYLCSIFDAKVIHMDNFFLPFERKTPERLAEAGGNIDYERFIEIALPALQNRKAFSYMAYNCQTSSYNREISIDNCELIIVEGSYSLHEKFGVYYDFALFLTVPAEVQLERLKNRCGDTPKFSRFKNEWIPMETHYHEAQQVKKRCDVIIDTAS